MMAAKFSNSEKSCALESVRPFEESNRKVTCITTRHGLRCILLSEFEQRLSKFVFCVRVGLTDGVKVASLEKALTTSERFVRFEDFIKLNNGAVHPTEIQPDYTIFSFEVHPSALTLAIVKFAEVIAASELANVQGKTVTFESAVAQSPENEALAGLVGVQHPFSRLLSLYNCQLKLANSDLSELLSAIKSDASKCSVVVSGIQDLSQLQLLAEKYSEAVFKEAKLGRNKKPLSASISDVLFPAEKINKLVVINSESPNRLTVSWPLATTLLNDRTKPLNFLSYLIDDDEVGTLLSSLRDDRLITDLQSVASPSSELESNRRWTIFRVVFMLTNDGVTSLSQVLYRLFQYINHVKATQVEQYIYDEASMSARIRHLSTENNLNSLAINVQQFKDHDCLLGQNLPLEFDKKNITETLSMLRSDTAYVTLEGDFDSSQFADKVQSAENIGLIMEMPTNGSTMLGDFVPYKKNPLVPDTLNIVEELRYLEDYPNVIAKGNSYKLWYKFQQGQLPRVWCYVNFGSVLLKRPEWFVCAEVLCGALERRLGSRRIAQAGIEFSVSALPTAITIKVVAFNNTLDRFVESWLVTQMNNFVIDDATFDECRRDLLHSYGYRKTNAAYAESLLGQIFSEQLDLLDCCEYLEKLTAARVNELFAKLKTENSFTECFVYGNCTADYATALMNHVGGILNPLDSDRPKSIGEKIHYRDESRLGFSGDASVVTLLCYEANTNAVPMELLVEIFTEQLHVPDACTSCLARRRSGREANGFTVEIACPSKHQEKSVAATKRQIHDIIASIYDGTLNLDKTFFSTKSKIKRRHHDRQALFNDEGDAYFDEITNQTFQFGSLDDHDRVVQSLDVKEFIDWLRKICFDAPVCTIRVGPSSSR